MAKIQVEVGGQLQDVTKSQLFDLAKNGDIAPETRLVVDGKETKARKVQGIEFAEDVAIESSISLPSTDNPFLSPDAQPTVPPPAPMPVPATKWFDTQERKFPKSFCEEIGFAIGLTNGLFIFFLVPYVFTFLGGIIGLLTTEGDMVLCSGMIIWSAVTFPFFLLSWKVVILFLTSMRATFCHQYVVEKLLKSQQSGDEPLSPSP